MRKVGITSTASRVLFCSFIARVVRSRKARFKVLFVFACLGSVLFSSSHLPTFNFIPYSPKRKIDTSPLGASQK